MNFIKPFEYPTVMVFKKSCDSQEKLYNFSKHFGEFHIEVNHYSEEKPWLFCLANESAKPYIGIGNGVDKVGGYWHLDYGFLLAPAKYTILRCVMMPPNGGETSFLDLMSAYRDLPEEIKVKLETLWAVRDAGILTDKEIAHPLVMTHPILKKKHLFFSYRHLTRFLGPDNKILDTEESLAIKDLIMAHIFQDKYIYTHVWDPNDLIVWYNKCTMHKVNFDFDQSYPRWMERVAIAGEQTGKYI
jgi:taurine dioxygenase